MTNSQQPKVPMHAVKVLSDSESTHARTRQFFAERRTLFAAIAGGEATSDTSLRFFKS